MKKIYIRSTLLLCYALLALQAPFSRAEKFKTNASITFSGTSTLHDFEGVVSATPFITEITQNSQTGEAQFSAITTINVSGMTTQHKKRDKNMFKMLDAENFTLITGRIENALLPETGDSQVMLNLKICNEEHDVVATLSDWKREENRIRCRMAFPVSLKTFGLKAPSVMGVIRVGDTVNVECNLEGTVQ